MIRSEHEYTQALLAFRWPDTITPGTPEWWPALDGLHILRLAQLRFDPDYLIWNAVAPPLFTRDPPHGHLDPYLDLDRHSGRG